MKLETASFDQDVKVGEPIVDKKLYVNNLASLTNYFKYMKWDYKIWGFGSMISSPIYLKKWYLLPRSMDKSIIPDEGLQRLNTLYEMGVNVQGEVIGHEIRPREKNKIIEVDWMALGERLTTAATGASRVAGDVVTTAAISGLVLVDPVLIVIVDNTRVRIYKWFV